MTEKDMGEGSQGGVSLNLNSAFSGAVLKEGISRARDQREAEMQS